MTNTDLVKRLRANVCPENMGCGTQPYCSCDAAEEAADAIEALTAERDVIAAATVERCAAEIQAKCQVCNGTGHQGQDQCPYCGYPIDAIRALAAPDTEEK